MNNATETTNVKSQPTQATVQSDGAFKSPTATIPQFSRRNCLDIVIRRAQKTPGAPNDVLRAELEQHPGCKDVSPMIPDSALEAVRATAQLLHIPTAEVQANKTALAKPEPLPFDPTVIPSKDFIRDYVSYADRFEIPPRLHEIVAMAGIAAGVNGNVTINTGDTIIPFDFWVMTLTRSGGGKNTLLRALRNLMKAAGLEHAIHKESFGSASQIQEYFSQNPTGFFIWPEMGGTLAQLKQKQIMQPNRSQYPQYVQPGRDTPSGFV